MFLLVFGIQEGSTYDWSGRIWLTIAAGVILLGVFVWYQSRNRGEPLLPLELFADRNFTWRTSASARWARPSPA